MRTSQFLFIAGLATVASAELDQRNLADCSKGASKLQSEFYAQPTPAQSLANFIDHQITSTVTASCVVPSVTGSLASEYTSFMSDLSSWYLSYSSAYASVIKACSDVPQVTSEFATYTSDFCSELKWERATGSGNAAPRETGMAMAAAAMAGFVVAGVV
ncbi:hypothetical protein BGZ63DRAFT_407592 [Mariannaea sp. PMI_226]|nr:hypothetical protein BGZ63DRAFT_407592 [Mariannaea sp. PMI_226]